MKKESKQHGTFPHMQLNMHICPTQKSNRTEPRLRHTDCDLSLIFFFSLWLSPTRLGPKEIKKSGKQNFVKTHFFVTVFLWRSQNWRNKEAEKMRLNCCTPTERQNVPSHGHLWMIGSSDYPFDKTSFHRVIPSAVVCCLNTWLILEMKSPTDDSACKCIHPASARTKCHKNCDVSLKGTFWRLQFLWVKFCCNNFLLKTLTKTILLWRSWKQAQLKVRDNNSNWFLLLPARLTLLKDPTSSVPIPPLFSAYRRINVPME